MTNSTLQETIPIQAIDSGVLKIYSNTSSVGKYSESNYLRGRFPLLPLPFLTNYALLELYMYGAMYVAAHYDASIVIHICT